MNTRALQPPQKSSSRPPVDRKEPWRHADWQRMWIATQQRPWRSLALVPADGGEPLDFTLDVAASLARIGMMHLGTQIHVADATRLRIEHTGDFVQQLRATMRDGPVILALAPINASPVTVRFAQSSDCAILCVVLKRMAAAEARRTVDEIGRDHFLGAVTFE